MSTEDPKTTLINLIKGNIALARDDNQTPATVHVSQEWFSSQLLKDYDVQVTVGLAEGSLEKLNVGGSWVRYGDCYRIMGWCIDKTGVTGKKLRWKLRREIEQVIRAYRKTPGGSLSFVDLKSVLESEDANSKPPFWKLEVLVITYRYVRTN